MVAACAYAAVSRRASGRTGTRPGLKSGLDGELKSGSVMPNVKFSSSFVALIVPPTFTLWLPAVYDTSALTPMFVSFRSCDTVAG